MSSQALAEFCSLYEVPPLDAENRLITFKRCHDLIDEERHEVIDALEKFQAAEFDSDSWWAAAAHLAKELADLKYVSYYAAHVLDLPILDDTPETGWDLTGKTTQYALDSLNALSRSVPGGIREDFRLFMLQGDLTNLVFAVDAVAAEMGIPVHRVFEAVHRSNMDKRWEDGEIHRRKDGKIKKPPGWVGPEAEIEQILRESMTASPAMP
ncbi:hypothetical protein AB0G15_06010 [Streptosporangium sp. NPDC023825]|uniref:hypothetical protein n=1 Tax=Streptosporangium sp. NPDC023825 TaxID=3154909 RepID=UPI003438CA55